MKKFNLIIIGGGAAAFGAAIRANELKAKTAIINAGLPLGGTCVNVGCVPSKMLLHAAEILHQTEHHHVPGIKLELKNFNFQKVVENELSLVKKLRQEKYEKVLKNLKNVTLIRGKAKFVSKNKIEVNGEKLSAEKFIIAVGSTANVPPIEGIKKVGYLTHIKALRLKKKPQKLAIVGAGPLGLEFAQMYSRFGTKVIILEASPTIFKPGEPELVKKLREILNKEGIVIYTNTKVKRARKKDNKKILTFEVEGEEKEIVVNEILLAAGKTPNTQGLGLEMAEIEINKRQAIVVNQYFQTSNKNIFAVGDATSMPLRLETTAGHEGTLAAENALKNAFLFIDYNTVPYTIFTDPQLAGIGVTEKQQLKQKKTCACRIIHLSNIPKAIIMKRTEGLIKMIIHPQTRQILGVHILAPNAGEIIAQAMTLIKNKNTIDDVIHSLPVFPTLSEAIKIAALSFKKDIAKLSCCI